jgi:hypothetical protein
MQCNFIQFEKASGNKKFARPTMGKTNNMANPNMEKPTYRYMSSKTLFMLIA